MVLFKNRLEAGKKLAQNLKKYQDKNSIVLAIPRGGVQVGYAVAKKLNCPLDVIIPRKLPIPENPEMGFGAIISDGTVMFNEPVVSAYQITQEEIKNISQQVLKEIKRREKIYRGKTGFPEVKDKIVILVDDGLATGFTMLAAIKAIEKHQPKKIVVAVPVSPIDSFYRIKPEVDELVCLHVEKSGWSFAVASYFKDFHDLKDEEVVECLHTI